MGDAHDLRITEGLAAIAISVAEMGGSDEDIKAQVMSMIAALRVDDPTAVLRAAAGAVARLPAPLEESSDKSERHRRVREMLGVKSAEEQLVASLRGREVLERMASDFEAGR